MSYWGLSDEYLSFAAKTYAEQLRLCTKVNSSGALRFVFDRQHKRDIETFQFIIVPYIKEYMKKKHKVVLERCPNRHHFVVFWVKVYLEEN
jgi:hypothetical protein